MTFGIDYAWGRPSVSTLKKDGVEFVARYVSSPGNSKNLTLSEAKTLSSAGISIVVVFETTATRAEAGHAAGVADAKEALKEATACGMPSGRPIFFAVDEDTTVGPHVTAYFQGVASVLGLARTGVYGGYAVVKGCFDHNLVKWGWQTYAWSGGRWDARAQLQQYSNSHTIDGVDVDYDRVAKATIHDYGQWTVGNAPKPQPKPQPKPVPHPTLRTGSTGAAVKALQTLLNHHGERLKIDGQFGPKTHGAVVDFQHKHGLSPDGIAGPKTWLKLLTTPSGK